MPKLGDVIGAFLSDVARARVHADLEAVRIAEAYSRDPLLKHLTVPRFRLPDVVVDLPVLVSAVDQTAVAGDAGSVVQPTEAELRKTLREAVIGSGIRVPRTQLSTASATTVQRSKELFGLGGRSLIGPARISDELAKAFVEAVQRERGLDSSDRELEALRAATNAAIATLLSTKLVPSPAVDVVITSAEIKAHADNESIVRLRLTITEDSYEIVSRDDGQGYYLSPE